MWHFVLILLSLGLGAILRRTGSLPDGTHRVLNAVIIHVSFPALTLLHLHRLPIEPRAIFPALMAWILFIAGGAFIYSLGKSRGWTRETIAALILTGGLANTSFVGFPMIDALFGHEALGTAILTDQLGSFFALSILGIAVASFSSGKSRGLGDSIKRILRFPPFYAMIAAFLLSPVTYPEGFKALLEALSAPLAPLALLSVGIQLNVSRKSIKAYAPMLLLGLFFKLLLGPAIIAALYLGVLGLRGEDILITIVQAAMPPMILGAVLANEYDLEPRLANLMVGIGIPLALLTVPAWFWILRMV